MHLPDTNSNYSVTEGLKPGGRANPREEALVSAGAVLLYDTSMTMLWEGTLRMTFCLQQRLCLQIEGKDKLQCLLMLTTVQIISCPWLHFCMLVMMLYAQYAILPIRGI